MVKFILKIYYIFFFFFEKSKICGGRRCAAKMSTVKMSKKPNFDTSSKTVTQ